MPVCVHPYTVVHFRMALSHFSRRIDANNSLLYAISSTYIYVFNITVTDLTIYVGLYAIDFSLRLAFVSPIYDRFDPFTNNSQTAVVPERNT